jgi:hypothetical protein
VEADADGVEKLKVLFGRVVVLVLRCAVGSVLCGLWFSRGGVGGGNGGKLLTF